MPRSSVGRGGCPTSTCGRTSGSRRGRRGSRASTERNKTAAAPVPIADNPPMRLRFTKMQGAGNDFVMLNGIAQPFSLDAQQLRALADRRFGVGADQILLVE